MANSRYSYVRLAELPDPLLPSTFLLVRIDGKGFHRFSTQHAFAKPNDSAALDLMNAAARRVVAGNELRGDVVLAFGESDEFSFVFKRSCKLYGRRASKLVTLVVSLFSSAYTFLWPQYFPNSPLVLEELPVFDGRIVQYSTETEVRDYFRWRQVDTHINNMYNTCFWSLVHSGRTEPEAHKELSGTLSSQKQELLFSRFGINYNNLPAMFRKGSLLLWEAEEPPEEAEDDDLPEPNSSTSSLSSVPESLLLPSPETAINALKKKRKPGRSKRSVVIVHEDLIADAWWETGRGAGILAG